LAASKKLLRSVFYKGMAAAVIEALDAARAAGDEPWLREHIAAELTAADAGTIERIIDGTRRHAVRRAAEMEAAADMLTELGVPPAMADASRALHERLAQGPPQATHTKSAPRAPRVRPEPYSSDPSASASGPSESGFACSGRPTTSRSTPASR
jgi:3-hydroxyisobutyrate dehydrogenase-like beta-hydroxyacid dehydrogenase